MRHWLALLGGLLAFITPGGQAQGPKKGTASLVYLNQDDLSPTDLKRLVDKYTEEFFSPYNSYQVPGSSSLHFILDSQSFLLESDSHPDLAERLKSLEDGEDQLQILDVRDQYKNTSTLDGQLGTILNLESQIGEDLQASATYTPLRPVMQRLKLVLNNVFSIPRSYSKGEKYREMAAEYISRTMLLNGLLTGVQTFQPAQFHDMFFNNVASGVPTGTNIVGILPGENFATPNDQILVIGAHWDTMPDTDGYNDNGSGVVAMLEVAKLLTESKCKLKHSVMFAAFDLEEVGSQGSLEFVQKLLVPHLRKYGQSDISGAIILDTILNFNQSTFSQKFEHGDKLPRVKSYLEGNNFTGDYLTAYSRRSFDDALVKKLERYWNRQAGSDKYHFVPSDLKFTKKVPNGEEIKSFINFLRSDHTRFWFPLLQHEPKYNSFNAILLTDTGPERGQMQECYHKACDSVRHGFQSKFANFDFYAHTIKAVLDTTLDITVSTCPPRVTKTSLGGLHGQATRQSFNSCHTWTMLLVALFFSAPIRFM
eukprot:maker-scaffold292_size219010-snap-gene-1.34 protein:Tk00317 transcript:maker-scaffold292_size219010-snap-gene-1.34-mRNA-1 annotation:"hypothetical protein DAPPUDRAFT_306809"